MPATGDFGRVAQLYARVRPGYLPQVFDDLIDLAGLPKDGRILEIGPATGQATLPLAGRGYHIAAIEPDAPLAAEAQRRLQPSDHVEFHLSTFEAWPLPAYPFDLVLAATSFHWLDPETRYVKSAAALRPGGALAVINTHHVAGGAQAFFDAVQACYEQHMPGTKPGLALPHAEDIPPPIEDLIASGLFRTPAVRRYHWSQSYDTRGYIDLLSTYSDHIALAEAAREALFACISSLIDDSHGGRVEKQYMTELIVAKRSPAPRSNPKTS